MKYKAGEMTSDARSCQSPAFVPNFDIATIANIKATKLSGQPMKRPIPGMGTMNVSHAIARQIQAALPAMFDLDESSVCSAFKSFPYCHKLKITPNT
jgi:hypothetical protein